MTKKFWKAALAVGMVVCAPSAFGQENDEALPVAGSAPVSQPAPIVFAPGTGQGPAARTPLPNGVAPQYIAPPPRPTMSCTDFSDASQRLADKYRGFPVRLAIDDGANGTSFAAAPPLSRRLDPMLLSAALYSYARNNCSGGRSVGPQEIFIVDFAKRSSEPRMYRVDLKTGMGIDNPVLVAHGIGSDRDNDGYADSFSNIPDSRMSSLGAARGAEVYQGRVGRALRLDGLDMSNSQMRGRYVVVHSYNSDARRYFNAEFVSQRGNTPGMSDGCFVVEPGLRDWFIDTLANGGFLYAGVSGERGEQIIANNGRMPPVARPASTLQPGQQVIFAPGTGGNTR